ncbi:hypothetical protein HPHPA17_0746 [Helicobacter pylori Hp A-17]|nr:hypothetical protein HPHPA17_0746 [Helicobacter pylori Hp A-17]
MEKLPKKRVSKTKSQKLIHSLTTQKNRAFLKKISANEMLLELEKGAFKKMKPILFLMKKIKIMF